MHNFKLEDIPSDEELQLWYDALPPNEQAKYFPPSTFILPPHLVGDFGYPGPNPKTVH